MQTTRARRILFICISLLIVIAITGCRAAQKKPYSTKTPTPTTPAPRETTPKTTPVPMTQTKPLPTKTEEVAKLQDKLAKEAKKVPGVDDAWVVLSGKTALVGIQLDSDLPRGGQADAAGVKNDVRARVRQADSRLTGVAVATDAGTVSQLRKVAEGMRAGKPATTFSRDINDLVSKLASGLR